MLDKPGVFSFKTPGFCCHKHGWKCLDVSLETPFCCFLNKNGWKMTEGHIKNIWFAATNIAEDVPKSYLVLLPQTVWLFARLLT